MVMTINVPERIVRDAEINGISVEEQLARLADVGSDADLNGLMPIGRRFGSAEEAAAEQKQAAERMLSSRSILGGLDIREMINAGRKY